MRGFASVLGALFCFACSVGAGPALEDLYRVLEEHGVSLDSNAVDRAVLNAVLGTVDRRARIVPAAEEKEPGRGKTVNAFEEWAEGICYLKLKGLYDGGSTEVLGHVRKCVAGKKTGLIIDLRGAGGTSLSCVDGIASFFTSSGSVLYEVHNGRGELLKTHTAAECGPEPSLPLMLLVDRKTGDAAELLAFTVKGLKGIMLVGSQTMGDNAVRELLPLPGGDSVHVATGWVVSTDGKGYEGTGVLPDIHVEKGEEKEGDGLPEPSKRDRPMSDKERVDRALMERVAGDAVLVRATDILLGLKALKNQVPSADE